MNARAIRRALSQGRDDLAGAFALRMLGGAEVMPRGQVPEALWPESELLLRAVEAGQAERYPHMLGALRCSVGGERLAGVALLVAGINPLLVDGRGVRVRLSAAAVIDTHGGVVNAHLGSAVLQLGARQGGLRATLIALRSANQEACEVWDAELLGMGISDWRELFTGPGLAS